MDPYHDAWRQGDAFLPLLSALEILSYFDEFFIFK